MHFAINPVKGRNNYHMLTGYYKSKTLSNTCVNLHIRINKNQLPRSCSGETSSKKRKWAQGRRMDVMVNEIGVYCLANTGSGTTREVFFSASKRHCFNAVLATAEKQVVFFFFFFLYFFSKDVAFWVVSGYFATWLFSSSEIDFDANSSFLYKKRIFWHRQERSNQKSNTLQSSLGKKETSEILNQIF